MTLTPETLPRHELVGLHVRVVESTDQSRVGIEGRVVDETMQTLLVESHSTDSGVTQIPKRGARFEFELTDEAAVFRQTQSGGVSASNRHPAKETGTASKPAGGSGQTTGEGVAYVTVDGVALLSRPALRSETGVDSKWR
ncbi:ribonuclease P protein component 1 [Halobacterium litoreum]|uniref:Ribonuclease P protein component 1 n=1 Tax=Halobacterium litoreum TaxID=2039234 RepID=A0ABD5NDI3_9EURY|nr:ribonuclease P protein component 1 [Halobacterium litoreum]UHH13983.1 ribonuclease P protein component 1 [Halobacterium litoreum]